jgi:hypothetical protein
VEHAAAAAIAAGAAISFGLEEKPRATKLTFNVSAVAIGLNWDRRKKGKKTLDSEDFVKFYQKFSFDLKSRMLK